MAEAHTKLVVADQSTERPQQTLIFGPFLRSFGKSLCYKTALQLQTLQLLFIGPIGVFLVCKRVHTRLSRENWHRHVVRDAAMWRKLRATGVEGVERGFVSNELALACVKEGRVGGFDVWALGGCFCCALVLRGCLETESGEFRVGGNRTSFSCGARGPSPHNFWQPCSLGHSLREKQTRYENCGEESVSLHSTFGNSVVWRCCLCFGSASVGSTTSKKVPSNTNNIDAQRERLEVNSRSWRSEFHTARRP